MARRFSSSRRGDGMISRLPGCLRREFGVRNFEFQKTNDVGLGFSKPVRQVPQATVDVDIETGDFIGARKKRSFAAWS